MQLPSLLKKGGGHIYGVSVNGVREFVSDVLYNAVKRELA
jgi:hypothetical protein